MKPDNMEIFVRYTTKDGETKAAWVTLPNYACYQAIVRQLERTEPGLEIGDELSDETTAEDLDDYMEML